jgi:hypothetical protein
VVPGDVAEADVEAKVFDMVEVVTAAMHDDLGPTVE